MSSKARLKGRNVLRHSQAVKNNTRLRGCRGKSNSDNKTGELLLKLGKSGTDTTVLQRAIAFVLNESATVTALAQKENLLVMDMDDTTIVEEVLEAIPKIVGLGCDARSN